MYLIFLFVLTIFSSISYAVFPGSKDYVINGCRIFEPNQFERVGLPGERCIFLNNGDFISSNHTTIKYFNAKNEVKWLVHGVFHHQLNLSADGKRILAISSVKASRNNEEMKRFDQLLIIDMTGKVVRSLDTNLILGSSYLKTINMLNPYKNEIDSAFEGSHVNSFYEIPNLEKDVKVPSYIRPGNYIVNSLSQGVLILDKDLKKILKEWVSPFSIGHNIHDAQISSKGTLIYFNNISSQSRKGAYFSSIDEYDFISNKKVLEIKANPPSFFFSKNCGGVQILDPDLIMFSHVIAGYHVYSRKNKAIIYSGIEPYFSGDKISTAQQLKITDLTNFLKNRN